MGTLFTTTGTLAPADEKTVRSFAFDVPAGVSALALVFEWDPAASEDVDKNRASMAHALASWGGSYAGDPWEHPDIKRNLQRLPNLLNTVLVEPSGRWRGRSDRGKGTRDNPLLVDPHRPAPGFMHGALPPGRWSIDLEVHAIVSERVEFFLEIASAEPCAVRRPTELAPHSPQRRVAGPGWYRGELHSHTRHSDGSHTVDELLRRAHELGFDFLALTDHNTTAGASELRANAFPSLLGAELTTFRGHHVCLGIDEMVPWHRNGVVFNPNDVAREVRDTGALFALTHPFNLGDPVCAGCRWMTPELDLAQVDLIEIWHRKWTGDSADNRAARELWDDMWKRGLRPTAVGVRDWHNKNHEVGPLPMTVVHARSLTQRDVLDGIKRGAVYITRGPAMDFVLHVDSARLTPGERARANGAVTAVIGLDSLVDGARVELYRCGEKVAEAPASRSVTLADTHGGPGWYRVEVWDDAGPICIANHIELLV